MVERKPRLHPQVKYTVIQDEGLVITQEDGFVHIVNEVAASIVALLDGNHTVGDMIDRITEEYDVSREEAKQDLLSFLDELTELRVIDDGPEPL